MRVAVIGGGPAGLVTLKYLTEAHGFLGGDPVEARLFEGESDVGGTFLSRTYEDAELVSSKQLTTFSDFRPRDDDPDFLSAERYIQYLRDYCSHFRLWPRIHLSTTVTSVSRLGAGGHTVRFKDKVTGEEGKWTCDAIAVCSGLHVLPNIPQIEGIENVPFWMHSSEFKTKGQFGRDKTVLVLGSGETGADVAYMAVTSPTKRVVWCHRDGFHLAPKRNPSPTILPILGFKRDPNYQAIPVDTSRASLFDTAYVHPLLRNHMALWYYYDFYVKTILWTTYGTLDGMDQWVGGIPPARHKAYRIFFNKASKVAPYLSAPYRPKGPPTLGQRIRSAMLQPPPIPDLKGRQVDLAPWPESIDGNGVVHFRNNGRKEYERMKDEKIKPDVVVFCTGYRQEFPFFKDGTYPTPHEADVREIWKREDPSVAFVGFIRPSLGAIPPLAEMQAQLWVLHLLAPERIPRPLSPAEEPHYRLLHPKGSRITYGVDHESYAYQLALDMDTAPSVGEVVSMGIKRREWRLPLVWALGANFNTKFRLRGPWKWDGAADVMTGELWQTVVRRQPFFGHFTLSALPMLIFGPVSLLVWVYATVGGWFRAILG